MDYEKKYNKALEKAKRLYEGKDKAPKEPILEYLFPELCENEDEKTRKQLISICDEWLGGGYSARPCLNDVKWLKNLLEKQEQKPAEWSKEDEQKIHFLSRLIEFQVGNGKYCFGNRTVSKQEAIEMLQSLRPQPQGVYKIAIESILKMCESYEKKGIFTDERAIDFLGNVRVKCKDAIECAPILDEPSWKPSEEQMEALRYVAYKFGDSHLSPYSILNKALASLYEQLKKL